MLKKIISLLVSTWAFLRTTITDATTTDYGREVIGTGARQEIFPELTVASSRQFSRHFETHESVVKKCVRLKFAPLASMLLNSPLGKYIIYIILFTMNQNTEEEHL